MKQKYETVSIAAKVGAIAETKGLEYHQSSNCQGFAADVHVFAIDKSQNILNHHSTARAAAGPVDIQNIAHSVLVNCNMQSLEQRATFSN